MACTDWFCSKCYIPAANNASRSCALHTAQRSALCRLVVHCNTTLLLALLVLPFDPQIIAYNVPPPPMPFTPPPCFESLMGPEETAVFLHNKQPGRKERICPSCMTQYRCEGAFCRLPTIVHRFLCRHRFTHAITPGAAQPPCMLCTEGSTLLVQLKKHGIPQHADQQGPACSPSGLR